MDLAGDARALLLAHGLEIHREGAQAPVRLAKLLLRPAALGSIPRLAQRPVHRRNQPRQPRLEHVIRRPALERLDGHLLAQRARHENERVSGQVLQRQMQGSPVAVKTAGGLKTAAT